MRNCSSWLKSFTPSPSSYPSTKLSPQSFTQQFLALLKSLSHSPNNPKTLTNLDSLLHHSHLLDPATSLILLRGLSLTRKLTRAKQILSDLNRRNNIPPTFLHSVAPQCLTRDGTMLDTENLWADVGGRPVDASAFVQHMCRRSQNASELERLYYRISSSSRRLREEGYVALIGAFCRLNYPSAGRAVMNEMVERGMEVDDLTYFALFCGFCRAGSVPEADSVLRDWSCRRAPKLDVSVYGNFLYALCKSGKFREARKLFDRLIVREKDTGKVLRRLTVREEDMGKVLDRLIVREKDTDKLFDGMTGTEKEAQIATSTSATVKPGRRAIFQLMHLVTGRKIMAFEAYFRSLCSVARLDDAEKLLKSTMKNNVVPEICVYNCFIKALFNAGRADDALLFFKSERNKGHVSCRDLATAVVFGLCDAGRVDEGQTLLDEIVREGFIPTARIWNHIIKSYWKLGRVKEAIEVFGSIRPNAETYGTMITKFLEDGEIERGVHLFDEMLEKKLEPSEGMYTAVVRGLYRSGRVEEVSEWVNEMIENEILVSYDGWESLYDSLGDDVAEFWKNVQASYVEAKEKEKKRVKGTWSYCGQ